MNRLWRDTLFRRLFLLMWAALVASHFAAWWAVTRWAQPDHAAAPALHTDAPPDRGDRPEPPRGDRPPPPRPDRPPPARGDRPAATLPTFPSLPPTPGVPEGGVRAGPARESTGLRPGLLALDYGVRLLLIALAAWFGAAWLARPVQRLVAAARTLGQGLHPGRPLPRLDAAHGTVEVKEAAQVFNTMAEQLQAQFHSRSLLMAAISHDLRTPLTRMRMRLERMGGHDDATRRCIADIHEMDALIASSLQVFRTLDAAEPAQPTDLFALLQSLTDDLAETGRPVALEGAPLVAPVQVLAMRRAVDNLVQNALRYGGNARVALHAGPRITVDDDGPGIPEAELQAVFEPFYRVEASRSRDTGGTGLGLAIARELLARQGWALTLHNRPEGGLRAELQPAG